MNMTTNKQALDAQARRMRNYLNTAVISGVKLLHLTTDELSGLLDELEAAERRNAELSDSHSKLRETMAAIHNTIKQDGFATPLAVIMQNAKRAHEESADAAGITVKGDSE